MGKKCPWIQLRENGRLQFVHRRVGEAFHPDCVATTTKHPLKVMFFGAISHIAKSKLVAIKGTVTAETYQATMSGNHQSRKEGLEGHHSRVPRKSLQKHDEAHGVSDSRRGPPYKIQVII